MKNKQRLQTLTVMSLLILSLFITISAQDLESINAQLRKAEANARAKAPAKDRQVKPNGADEYLEVNTVRVNKTKYPSSASLVKMRPNDVKPAVLSPPNLQVFFDVDSPRRGASFGASPLGGVKQSVPADFNDKISTVLVPFGLRLRLCEDDGGGGDYGKCSGWFTAGEYFVGNELNDKASSFWIEETNEAYLYFTSASDEVPPGLTGGAKWTSTLDGKKQSTNVMLSINRDWYTKVYSVEFPPTCKNPDIWETTKAGESSWTYTFENQILKVTMNVKPKILTQGNNWVGVGVRCKP